MTELADSTKAKFEFWLKSFDGGTCAKVKFFPDGTYGAVKPLIYHWTLIFGLIGNTDNYEDQWCYATRDKAMQALKSWSGEGDPDGWHRHPRTGRRRPDGDPTKEYTAA